MAFKNIQPQASVPESPDKLFLDLPRRKFPDVMPNQREIMKSYATEALEQNDVAMQLPTGSGKTLVGLLIAEWRKRKYRERVVYLCPTRQLVNQVVEQADEKYGLTVNGFTGSAQNYSQTTKAEYRNADKVAITTYSSLFNTNPFFNDADILIIDDAHVAENYVASLWTLRVERDNNDHKTLHNALCGILKPLLKPLDFARLEGESEGSSDLGWVDKIPTPELFKIKDALTTVFDLHLNNTGLEYSWSMLRDYLHACHLYISSKEILLRPLIPPTWSHGAFNNTKQRIYMSATLGAGGDLERLMGRPKIFRLPIPDGWDRQGVGRRFFIFPSMSLDEDKEIELSHELIKTAGRSLILVPNTNLRDQIIDDIQESLNFPIYNSEDIEVSKKPFISEDNAVAIVANRYDGIDFPGDECRLLFIEGLPKAMNLQERFLMSRMGAMVLFNERIQTRVLQAIGRCTRSLEDYSAIVLSGEELPDYLSDIRRREYYHPELQAELLFGVEQSKNISLTDIVENFKIFLDNGKEWETVNEQIVNKRKTSTQKPFPGLEDLKNAVEHEIAFQTTLWQGDFEAAYENAEKVLACLLASELRGYRALWHYLAGCAAWLGAQEGVQSFESKAKEQFGCAKDASPSLPWLVSLARYQSPSTPKPVDNSGLMYQVEQIEIILGNLGTIHDRDFAKREKEILDGLNTSESFEHAHKLLGDFLGYSAGKKESDGSPDPWWTQAGICFVFEDHAGADENTVLDVTKARQVSSHPNWIKANIEECKDSEIIPVLVTPVTKIKKSAFIHLENVEIWQLDEFREWAIIAISTIRNLRKTFLEPGDLEWRANAADALQANLIDAKSLANKLRSNNAKDKITQVN